MKFGDGLFEALDSQNMHKLHKWVTNKSVHKNAPNNRNILIPTAPQKADAKKMGLSKNKTKTAFVISF